MRITEHFYLSEFNCRDGTAYPERWIESRLLPMCETLESIRSRVGTPITISSGYRTLTYNRSIGGARFSQHCEGRATDFTCKGWNLLVLKDLILTLVRKGIIYIGGFGLYSTFIHIDLRPNVGRIAYWEGSRSSN